MYPESSPIDGIDPVTVAADDGTVFCLTPAYLGGANSPYPAHVRLRWVIRRLTLPPRGEEARMEFVGPPIQPDRSPEAVRVLVNEWWDGKKGLEQA